MFDNSKVSDIQVMSPELRKENCKFVKMYKDKDPNSKSYRATIFDFVDAGGAVLSHREFAPNQVIAGNTVSIDDFKKNISLAHSRVAHISRAFLSEAEFLAVKTPASEDYSQANVDRMWDEYIKQTSIALKVENGIPGKAVGVACALKVVLNHQKSSNKDFSGFPKVPPFISTANHPKEFTINAQYDKFEKERITPDVEKSKGSFGAGQQQSNQPINSGGFGGGAPASTGHDSDF